MPPALLFLLRIALVILALLFFQMNFMIYFSSSIKNVIGILVGITLNFRSTFRGTAMLTILILPIQEHWEVFPSSNLCSVSNVYNIIRVQLTYWLLWSLLKGPALSWAKHTKGYFNWICQLPLGDSMGLEMVVTSFFSYVVRHLGLVDEVMSRLLATAHSLQDTQAHQFLAGWADCTTSDTQSQECIPSEQGHSSGYHGSLWVPVISCWTECRASSKSCYSTLWPLWLPGASESQVPRSLCPDSRSLKRLRKSLCYSLDVRDPPKAPMWDNARRFGGEMIGL